MPWVQPRDGAYSVFDAFFRCDRYTHLPLPLTHLTILITLLPYIYMYVGRSIQLQIAHQHITTPRCARVRVRCRHSSGAPHLSFSSRPRPSSLADSHPARATMTFKSPIPSSYLTPDLALLPLPSPSMRPSIVGLRPPQRAALHRPSASLLAGEGTCNPYTERVAVRSSAVERCLCLGQREAASLLPVPDPRGSRFRSTSGYDRECRIGMFFLSHMIA